MKKCNLILQYQVQKIVFFSIPFMRHFLKRESGASPERTGHCIQGASFENHCITQMCEKVKQAMICKSGNLPGT